MSLSGKQWDLILGDNAAQSQYPSQYPLQNAAQNQLNNGLQQGLADYWQALAQQYQQIQANHGIDIQPYVHEWSEIDLAMLRYDARAFPIERIYKTSALTEEQFIKVLDWLRHCDGKTAMKFSGDYGSLYMLIAFEKQEDAAMLRLTHNITMEEIRDES